MHRIQALLRPTSLLPWLLLAVAWTWPTAIHPITATPGSAHTDLWETLWTMWFTATQLARGHSPLRVDGLLDTPHGGSLWPSDPMSDVGMAPITLLAGPAVTWSLLVVGHMALRGWLGARIGALSAKKAGYARTEAAATVCGGVLALSAMALADVHNAASETLGDTWCLLVVWLGLRWRPGAGRRWSLVAGLGLAGAAIGHWYGGVSAGLLWLALGFSAPLGLADARELPAARREMRRAFALAAVIGVLLALPVAWGARTVSTASDNVVGIKNPAELSRLRRNIGPADPEAFVRPAPYRAPDFTKISRYGEDYWHCPYLGWVGLGLATVALLPRRRGSPSPRAPLWPLAVVVGSCALAIGPVLTSGGSVVILQGRRAVPLPYFLLEKLPPFDSLSLLWKLGWGAEVGVALLAALGAARLVAGLTARRAAVGSGVLLVLIAGEARFIAPTRGLPDHVDATIPAPILALRGEPDAKVMTWPLIGGLPTLYEQIGHGKMIAGTLNFPASKNAWNVTRSVLRGREAAVAVAKEAGIRYVVLHLDAPMGGDESGLQLANWDGFPVLAEDGRVRVLKLY